MTIQQILEHLLRSRLYRSRVYIKTDAGVLGDVRVEDVRYAGSQSFVVVSERATPEATFCIPLCRIRRVSGEDEAA